MVGMMRWDPAGHMLRPVTLREVSVLHVRFLRAGILRGDRTPEAAVRRRVKAAGKKLLRQGTGRVILPAGISAGDLPEGADRGQLLSVLWEMGALRPGQVSVQLKSGEIPGETG